MSSNSDNRDNKNFNGYIVFSLAFILFCEFFLISIMSTPNLTMNRTSERRAACFSNIRLLQSTVEMYNLEKNNPMKSIDLDILVKEKYLKKVPTPPDTNCIYSSEGNMMDKGKVYCKFHGFYDENKEKELKEKERTDAIKNKTHTILLFLFVCSIPALIYILFAIVSRNEAYICFIIMFILTIVIISQVHQISFLAYDFTH